MKRIFFIFIILFSIHVISSAQTRFTIEQISLGGISPCNSISYVQSIYGELTKIISNGKIILYGKDLVITTYGKPGNLYVKSIISTANNGWNLPTGISVGMNENVMKDMYGSDYYIFYDKGIKCYQYNGSHCLMYVIFGVKNHKIVSINVALDQ